MANQKLAPHANMQPVFRPITMSQHVLHMNTSHRYTHSDGSAMWCQSLKHPLAPYGVKNHATFAPHNPKPPLQLCTRLVSSGANARHPVTSNALPNGANKTASGERKRNAHARKELVALSLRPNLLWRSNRSIAMATLTLTRSMVFTGTGMSKEGRGSASKGMKSESTFPLFYSRLSTETDR